MAKSKTAKGTTKTEARKPATKSGKAPSPQGKGKSKPAAATSPTKARSRGAPEEPEAAPPVAAEGAAAEVVEVVAAPHLAGETTVAQVNEPSPQPAALEPADEEAPAEPRLPAVGTVIRKLDRAGAVRATCTVEAEGIRYGETLYTSLSAAAAAAARDLGLTSKSLNGWVWWGVTKPARVAGRTARDPLSGLERAYEAYRSRVNGLLPDEADEGHRMRVLEAVRRHADALAGLASRTP